MSDGCHMNKMKPCVGVDIGGTKIETVLLDGSGTVSSLYRIPSRPGEEEVVEDICKAVTSVTDAPIPIGIGIPGQVNPLTGQVRNVVNLDIKTMNLAERIHRLTHSTVHVENDVNAAALGATALMTDGLEEDSSAVFVNFGTGLAAGLVHNGIIEHGVNGTLGEIGHLPVDPNGFECPCGQRGCLETVASGGAVSRLWPSRGPSMPDLIDKASHDNHVARDVLSKIMHAMADTIQITAQAYDPGLIIIGGGMARTGQPLLDALTEVLERRSNDSPFLASQKITERLRIAPMDQPIGAIGAAFAAVQADRGFHLSA